MHEHICQDGEVVSFCGIVDPGGEQLADLIVLEIGLAMESGEG